MSTHVMRPRVRAAWAVAVILAVAGALFGARIAARDDWPDEAARLARLLGLPDDAVIAEIGAGRGELTVEMARSVVPRGRVYSTELDTSRLDDIRRAAEAADLDHVVVLEAGERDSQLPEGCCDAVFMREVYHHFEAPEVTLASIHRALRPGGLLAVIDFPERGPVGSNCHCIPKATLLRQVTAHGFEVVTTQDDWPGRHYLALFRKR